MGQRTIIDGWTGDASHVAVLYDSVTGWAFGPVFHSSSQMDRFLLFVEQETGDADCRRFSNAELESLWGKFNDKADGNA